MRLERLEGLAFLSGFRDSRRGGGISGFFRPTTESAADPERPTGERAEDRRFSALIALTISGVLAVGVLAAAVWQLLQLVEKDETGPEAALSLVFVATAVVLILVVCTLTIMFSGSACRTGARPWACRRGASGRSSRCC